MPFSTTTLVRFTAKLSRCLSLALLPALASETHAAVVGQPQRKQNVRAAQPGSSTPKAGALPYLAALGPLPLRFARPGPEPSDEPPASPELKVVAVKLEPAAENKAPNAQAVSPESTSAISKPADTAMMDTPPTKPEVEETYQPALPILPDDTKRELHPEDVLPFFRYPNASGNNRVEVIVPLTPGQSQPSQQPPSSATYQLK